MPHIWSIAPATTRVVVKRPVSNDASLVTFPIGSVVVYGQPDVGIVLIEVTEETKIEVAEILRKMKIANDNYSKTG